MLEPDFDTDVGRSINLYAPRDDIMVLPLGGVDALRKVPGHPMFDAPERSSSASNA